MNALILLTVIGSFQVISGQDLYKCPADAGWKLFNKTCYIFPDYFRTWNWAEFECEQMKGYLAIIKNEEEQLFIIESIPYESFYWIGLSRTDIDANTFRWVDGSELSGYTNWKLGEPNDIHEYCVEMSNKKLLGQWNDNFCVLNLLFICQKEASPQS